MTGNQTASQTVVVVAMGLVAGTGAVALYHHAGLPGPVAATAALAAYLLLLTVHAFVWRGSRLDFGSSKSAGKDARITRPDAPAFGSALAAGPALNGPSMTARGGQRPGPLAPPPFPAQAVQQGAAPPPPSQRASMPPRPQEALNAGPPPLAPQARAADQRPAPPPLPTGQPRPQTATDTRQNGDASEDFWSFRPAAPNAPELPPFVTGRASARAQEPTLPEPPQARTAAPQQPAARQASRQQSSAPREADVEVIQDAIKRLLEEVNAAEQLEARSAAKSTSPPPPRATSREASNAAIEHSIDALRMTANTMRAAHGAQQHNPVAPPPVPPTAPTSSGPQPPPLPPFVRGAAQQRQASAADARARLMADAISAGRIDVALEPILGLEDQQTRHYEVSVRLRDADGNPLEVTADGPDLRGTGLLPLFDGVRVTRTAAVARRLEERGKGGSVFSSFSGESVADEHFLGELAETLHQRATLASQLVLSFSQTDVRAFSTPEWDSLADMRSLGFRFALSAITDLDMDFEALAEQGFAFVKLDASVFLDGLPAPSGRIPSSDVCRHLAMHGLTLVVERIDDEDKLARVFGFGVLLGQGQLFGGRRPVRADVVGSRTSTVAA
jgi:cyclic-di-GMP phosphodiesterase TipF (flagellum assembly factor)